MKTHFSSDAQIVKAVDGVSFDVFKGETLGIVGESGSGKSVTMLSLLQMIEHPGKVLDGEAIYCDDNNCTDLLQISEQEIIKIRGSKIGMIYQHAISAFNPIQKIKKQLTEAITIHGKSLTEVDQKLHQLLRKVELENPERILKSYPHQLSGGQLQRCMIALAIVNDPLLLIADEPTTALDVITQQKILSLLKRLKSEMNMSMILISHDLAVIREMAERSLVMRKGKIIEEAEVENLFDNPKTNYTKALINARPSIHHKYDRLPVLEDFENNLSVVQNSIVNQELIEQQQNELKASDNILVVNNLSKTYGSKSIFRKAHHIVNAVDNVSFELKAGEVLGVVGESGSGKSTLARLVLNLEIADKGSVIYRDTSVLDTDKKTLKSLRKELQIIFQDASGSLDPRMSVYDALEIVVSTHFPKLTKENIEVRIVDLLYQVGLDKSYLKRFPHELSGGERQRVCIARALSLEPKVLICDECVSALDVTIQAKILNLLMDLRDQLGLSIIFISHDLAVINFISDRVLVMQSGKIVEHGHTQEIILNPQNSYTSSLVNAVL